MFETLWYNYNDCCYIKGVVHLAFVGFITESMQSSYVAQPTADSLELVIIFNKPPSKLDNNLVKREILPFIKDDLEEFGITTVHYKSLVNPTDEESYEIHLKYFPIFKKYIFFEYDLED